MRALLLSLGDWVACPATCCCNKSNSPPLLVCAGEHALCVCAGPWGPRPGRRAAASAAAGRAHGRAARRGAERRVCVQPLPAAPLHAGVLGAAMLSTVILTRAPASCATTCRCAAWPDLQKAGAPALLRPDESLLMAKLTGYVKEVQAASCTKHAQYHSFALCAVNSNIKYACRKLSCSEMTWSAACGACACGHLLVRIFLMLRALNAVWTAPLHTFLVSYFR